MNDDDPINALTRAELLEMTTEIVSAYVSNNATEAGALAGLVEQVHGTLAQISESGAAKPEPEKPEPAVSIKKSVAPDYIVCLEDGKKLKVLKRYLRTRYGLSPADYKAKWGLPSDYPMVAPNYSKARSEFAKTIGLGRKAKS
ncbi:MAG: MucR family transcriptional regulator [Alphaproteobacteria bacterium]|jgi:predicted transcriptional regulator|nr:MucR family transcriptional regulator [Rhodospirillaceae bacterium]MBT7614121.1 MucR family transcriptional regulator [Rhodospirillaceae bacterium]MBT7648160.1 MucR family transcriptional regulator [Rhodospirillaceae bacterium]MDG2483085.1 MucR family transcriptional regulator [Alphaproteobacteria bacterium]